MYITIAVSYDSEEFGNNRIQESPSQNPVFLLVSEFFMFI